MDYKERLIQFNSTDKYKAELKFIASLLQGEGTLLDFGCGICTAIDYFGQHTDLVCEGYDINPYSGNWYLRSLPIHTKYNHITFIHSIAHIENIEQTLKELKGNLAKGGIITVLTPNLDWINLKGDTKSDPTVINHFTSDSLRDLFITCGYRVTNEGQQGEQIKNQKERLWIQVKSERV
jgi:hypothetical protein